MYLHRSWNSLNKFFSKAGLDGEICHYDNKKSFSSLLALLFFNVLDENGVSIVSMANHKAILADNSTKLIGARKRERGKDKTNFRHYHSPFSKKEPIITNNISASNTMLFLFHYSSATLTKNAKKMHS